MKRWILIGMVVASGMTIQAQNKLPEKFPYQDTSLTAEERADDLLKRLTLEEKASLMMNGSPAIPRSKRMVGGMKHFTVSRVQDWLQCFHRLSVWEHHLMIVCCMKSLRQYLMKQEQRAGDWIVKEILHVIRHLQCGLLM
mgnify:CR=1 FL=1